MLTTLILAAVAGGFIGAVVVFVLLHWREIINWFEKWMNRHENVDKDAVGFTIREAIEKGKCKMVQGVFNKRTNKVEDARRIEAENVDAQTRETCLTGERVTIFN